MLNATSFSEDMLPRHFPKTKGQLEQKPAILPTPTLPGLSLLLDDDNKVFKPEPVRKVEPKKSFEQWKQQHQAMLFENTTTQQRRPDKKQVRFETNSPNEQPPVSPNLELSYHEGSNGENFCQNQWMHPQNTNKAEHFLGCEKNVLPPTNNYKPMNPSFACNKAFNAASQSPVDLPQLTNRIVRSDPLKENYISDISQPVCNEHRQSRRNCCQWGNWECNHGMQSTGCVSQRQSHPIHQHGIQSKTISPVTAQVERNLKEQLTDDTLLSIMEEQQQHILLQQSQIMMQQKQNMMQQNQIFMLQRQVQKLMLKNGINGPNESPAKHSQTSICDKPTTPAIPSALQNAFRTRNDTIETLRKCAAPPTTTATRSSIGVMTSFLGNVNDGIPNGMQQFNERLTSKVANEKFIEKMGDGGEYSYKDSMLDKINDAIKNSSALIDYRNNGSGDGCASPNRQSDLNIATQALFYEASSTNNGYTNEPKTTDRSFALYMLGMKYDCTQDDASKNIDKRDWQPKHTNGSRSDQVSVNLSPEVYDYLKRHGLLKKE